MKVLFIDNHVGFYGAQKSLLSFLENEKDWDKTIIYPKPILFQKFPEFETLKIKLENQGVKVFQFYLPLYKKYKGAPETLRFAIANLVRNFLWKVFQWRLKRFIAKEKFDMIHLNSLTLFEIADETSNFFMHVRELLQENSDKNRFVENFKKLKGVVFIDEATKNQFDNISRLNYIILENPIDMTGVKEYAKKREELKSRYGIKNQKSIIISIIGKIREFKGVDRVIKAFNKFAKDSDAYLLVVGSGDKWYVDECKAIAESEKILFLGEEPEIEKIYAISDIIVRGEPEFCLGRTVYEGLYAGCLAIQPGSKEDIDKHTELKKFENRIFLYRPGNEDDLLNALRRAREFLSSRSETDRFYFSNAETYAKRLKEFFTNNLRS